MIIKKELVDESGKAGVTELASKYATSFACLLGGEEKIIVSPNDLFYDKEEAERFFWKKHNAKGNGSLSAIDLMVVDTQLRDGNPFFKDGVAYTPLTRLSSEERWLVEGIKQYYRSKRTDAIERPRQKRRSYCSLFGFGSELGHLVAYRLYKDKLSNDVSLGLFETFDLLSSLYELSWSIETVAEGRPFPAKLKNKRVNKEIGGMRTVTEAYDTLLFKGEAGLVQKYDIGSRMFRTHSQQVEEAINAIIESYVFSGHYDAQKLCLALIDSSGENLEQACRNFNSILSEPGEPSMQTALEKAGYTPEQLSRHKGVVGLNFEERTKRIMQVSTTATKILTPDYALKKLYPGELR